jgi:hypothetical protein
VSAEGKTCVTDQKNQSGLTWVNVRIKGVIIIILKPDSGIDQGKVQVTGQKGQHKLTRVNIWIKIIIIIVLKPDLRVYSRKGLGHESR